MIPGPFSLEPSHYIDYIIQRLFSRRIRKKLKVARRGLYSTAALCIADCALAPNDVVHSFISRGATTLSGAGALY
jgi:hypothetical protein